jgi:pSer/pThr/pTyr-binding forkhead associated (FHA) protein
MKDRGDDQPRAIVRGAGGEPLAELRPGEALRFGRHHENDVVAKDPSVSRFHATLRWDAAAPRPVLYDNGSQNGTLVDRVEVIGRAEPLVKPRTRLELGPHAYTIELEGVDGLALLEDAPDAVALFSEQGPELEGALEHKDTLRQVLLRLEVEQRSGTLRVRLDEGEGVLTVATGRIMDARLGGLRGLLALERLYEAPRGRYRFGRDMEPCDDPMNVRFSEFLRIRHGTHIATNKWRRDPGRDPGGD